MITIIHSKTTNNKIRIPGNKAFQGRGGAVGEVETCNNNINRHAGERSPLRLADEADSTI